MKLMSRRHDSCAMETEGSGALARAADAASLGMTLVELLIVISVIALLVGLAYPAYVLLQRQAYKSDSLRTMNQLSASIDAYLADYPLLGDANTVTASSFTSNSWIHLNRRPSTAVPARPAYLSDLPPASLLSGTRSSPVAATGVETATMVADKWGDPIACEVWNEPTSGSVRFVRGVRIRSLAGTPSNERDDLVLEWNNAQGSSGWKRVAYQSNRTKPPTADSWGQKWSWEP